MTRVRMRMTRTAIGAGVSRREMYCGWGSGGIVLLVVVLFLLTGRL
jgi:hypothetical protein